MNASIILGLVVWELRTSDMRSVSACLHSNGLVLQIFNIVKNKMVIGLQSG